MCWARPRCRAVVLRSLLSPDRLYRCESSACLLPFGNQGSAEMVQEETDISHDADGLACAAIADLCRDGGVDVNAHDLDPARRHVADCNGVKHGAETKDDSRALQMLRTEV